MRFNGGLFAHLPIYKSTDLPGVLDWALDIPPTRFNALARYKLEFSNLVKGKPGFNEGSTKHTRQPSR